MCVRWLRGACINRQFFPAKDIRKQGSDEGVHFFGVKKLLFLVFRIQLVHTLTGVVTVGENGLFQITGRVK